MEISSKLEEFIQSTVNKIFSELDEMTATADIAGYNTPFAFSGKNSKKKKKRNSTNSTGYKMVKEGISSSDINKIKKLIRSEVAMILKDLWVKKSMWGG